jgi:Ca2+-binding EF-hand superfamily protein
MQARREQCKADPGKCRAEMQARGQERFKRADANGDGRLTREEARNGIPMVARHFDQIDANKDGVVTMEELQAARKARGESRKGKSI